MYTYKSTTYILSQRVNTLVHRTLNFQFTVQTVHATHALSRSRQAKFQTETFDCLRLYYKAERFLQAGMQALEKPNPGPERLRLARPRSQSQHQAEPLAGDVALDGREPDTAPLQIVLHPQVHLVVVSDDVRRQGHHVRVPEREAPHAVSPAPLAGDLVQQPVPCHRHLRALEQQRHGREPRRRRRPPRRHAEARVERFLEREVWVAQRSKDGFGLLQELCFQGGVGVPEQERELRAGIHHRLPGPRVVRREHRRRDRQRLAADADAEELDGVCHAVEVGERQGGLVQGRVVERQEWGEVAVAEEQHAGVVPVGDAVREAARAGLRHEGERATVHAQEPRRRDAVRGRVVRGGHAAECRPQRRRVAHGEDVGGERAVGGGPVSVGQRHAAPARGPVAGRRRREVTGAALRRAAGHGGEGARRPRAERRRGARVPLLPGRRAEQPGKLAAGVEHHGDVLRRRADGEGDGEADVVVEPQLARRPRQRPRRHLPRPKREHAGLRRGPRRIGGGGPRPRGGEQAEEEETSEQRGRHGGDCDLLDRGLCAHVM
ncbi:unnamed protein product [Urochloa decumbens]|uniref:Uncharacterized protein n=1 Tax=Urochloa decumbens TaxID=240449 RepID=A0ABC8YQ30_9POAL